jgi:cytidine deaminase
MKKKLINLLNNSYSPYSNFRVSAIAIMKDGVEFKGVNIENASYGVCNCAERSAIFSAISNGYKKYDFEKLYVMCDCNDIGTPCFICRQVISELFEKDKKIICINPNGYEKVFTVAELCPYPFDDDTLNS